MNYMLLTADPIMAENAQNAGIERIFLDLEYINKEERQKGRNTVKSHNSLEDVSRLRRVIDKSELLVRVNPINSMSETEINRVIEDGADIVMLPMVIDAEEVEIFSKIIAGRAKIMPMIETAQALARIDDILEVKGIDEIFIGLNDLHISMHLSFMFELLSGGIVDYAAEKIKRKNIPFGFGGIAKIGDGMLKAEYILGEHHRLNSSSVILSQTFRRETNADNLKSEMQKLRAREEEIINWSEKDYENNRATVKRYVNQIVKSL